MQPEAVFELVTYAVDHVAICAGPTMGLLTSLRGPGLLHQEWRYWPTPGTQKPEVFKGKEYGVGAGESGSDITNEIASEASR